jgi:hypothetical protein
VRLNTLSLSQFAEYVPQAEAFSGRNCFCYQWFAGSDPPVETPASRSLSVEMRSKVAELPRLYAPTSMQTKRATVQP